ncbi:MAG TPA: glycosyltransferase family 4 protein [Hanamia sp.]|nr:glycosyltransferase family 4 protein [Hanamia sp.]
MKVLHVIYSFGVYGAEKHLLDLLPELKKNNIDCELLCICLNNRVKFFKEYADELNNKGVKTQIWGSHSKISIFPFTIRINKYLRKNNICILHTHLFSADLIGVIIKNFFFKQLVLLSTKHGYEENYLVQYGVGNKKIPNNFYYFISKRIIKRIDHNVAISNAISKMYDYLKLSQKPMKYIHHGINEKKANVHAAILNGDPKIVIVGRLEEMKGHKYLLAALPAIIKYFPGLQLYILGEGSLKSELEMLAVSLCVREKITFTGFVAPSDYLAQSEVIVLPSLFEPFGLVFIESFAARIPVVAFDAEAANEIIEDNITGFLVEKQNIEALAQKIIYVLKNPSERERIIENAYQKFTEYYKVERMAKETVLWYQEVLNLHNQKSITAI